MTANPAWCSSLTPIHYIWVGDFNHHHPTWDKPHNSHLFIKHNLDLTQPLLNMKMALPPFLPTLHTHSMGNHTRVNNIFCSEDILDTEIKCYTEDESRPVKTNHYPIIMMLDIQAPKATHLPRLNFHSTDWPEFDSL